MKLAIIDDDGSTVIDTIDLDGYNLRQSIARSAVMDTIVGILGPDRVRELASRESGE